MKPNVKGHLEGCLISWTISPILKFSKGKTVTLKGVTEFLIKHSTLLSSIVSVIFLGAFLWSIFKIFFESPDLEVTTTITEANLPSPLAAKYASSMDKLLDQLPKNKLGADTKQILNDVLEVSDFLSETNSKATYEITNHSNRTLKNIDIRIKNIAKLTAWGVSGNSLQSIEQSAVMKAMKEDPQTGIITFGGIEKLPPQSSLIIIIWGEIRQYFIDDPINVTYDGGSGKFIRTTTIKGFSSYIYENTAMLLILLLLLNTAVFLKVIDVACSKMKKESQSVQILEAQQDSPK